MEYSGTIWIKREKRKMEIGEKFSSEKIEAIESTNYALQMLAFRGIMPSQALKQWNRFTK